MSVEAVTACGDRTNIVDRSV